MLQVMKHYTRGSLAHLRIAILTVMEYPANMLGWLLSNPIQFILGFATIKFVVEEFGSVCGWGYGQLAFLYGISVISHALSMIFFVQGWFMGYYVIEGDFDRYLLRPMSVLYQFCFTKFNLVGITDLIPGICVLVYGFIQQAIDILLSSIEYRCIPYIRFSVALHYVSLLSENLKEIEHIEEVRYKMSVAFVVHYLCDKERIRQCDMGKFLEKVREFQFDKSLYGTLETNGIDKNNFTAHRITQLVLSTLEDLYQDLGMEKGESSVG